MIYFVQPEGVPYIKIGYTGNLPKRLATLKTYNGALVRVLGVCEGDRNVERNLHGALNNYRVRGEWFQDCGAVRETVASVARPYVPPAEEATKRAPWKGRERWPLEMRTEFLAILQASGMSAMQLAKAVGVTPRAAQGWLSGRSDPSTPAALSLALVIPELKAWLVRQLTPDPELDRKTIKLALAIQDHLGKS